MEKTDVVFSSIGADLYNKDLPSIFYFALSAKESLQTDPYNQPALALANRGFCVYSATLPFHLGDYASSKEAISHYIHAFKNGTDPLSPFIASAAAKIYQMAREGEINLSKTMFMGLSRGGMIASHLAAIMPEISFLYLFAPLTALSRCEEAQKQQCNPDLLRHFDLERLTPLLANRHIHISIGNQDLRVDTPTVVRWFLDLVKHSPHPSHAATPITLNVFSSIGWQGHGTPRDIFEACAPWAAKRLISS